MDFDGDEVVSGGGCRAFSVLDGGTVGSAVLRVGREVGDLVDGLVGDLVDGPASAGPLEPLSPLLQSLHVFLQPFATKWL
jgi:hypothetical protein